MSTAELIQLGYELDAGGFAGRELAVRRLVRDAREAGLAPAVVDVLADATAPDVARLRAFAAAAAAVSRLGAGDAPTRSVA